ncbi:putative signal-transduction protein containing cAMP-binding and CBS domains [Streptomyces netropsis]|uniref:CBS domain-containing protein n=1 Tax=Streptomyces syringium TaxID=76729 RepID=A0ABS4YBN3_9ACTN|nr:CBS domain-containing protein [Streptomyces syringium]MBP2406144.1 CBS domain-containing protein [Streptomyces syringium]SPE63956.1 putative signal-transduction protein containing cAMP-binding and CBS domains [Streptomyces netropsis]
MRARDLAVDYPSVDIDSDALEAARLMAEHKLPALLVLDTDGAPAAILPASQMIKTLVPAYVIEDPALAAVVDEQHADQLCRALAGRRVRDCLSSRALRPPVAAPDDTALEVAALMAQVRSPLVAVVGAGTTGTGRQQQGGVPRLLGVIAASHLLERLLGEIGDT